MKVIDGRLRSSPTDLANFLVCKHKSSLDLQVAKGAIRPPIWSDPLADVLRQRGDEHERRYVSGLHASGLRVVDLSRSDTERESDRDAFARSVAAMRAGADVIVQAPLASERWFGYADVLVRVDGPSALGTWHYEVHDTKLSRETKGGTILQLCVYTDIVSSVQQRTAEHFVVVTPAARETYRVADYAAFYRFASESLSAFQTASGETYPHPVEHCQVCRWRTRCEAERRADDHLSFVAGLSRSNQSELETRDVATLAALAGVPLPIAFVPKRGAKETYHRLREQARLQLEQRTRRVPVHEMLPIEPARGLCLLPEPSPGDMFLDLEGDPFGRRPQDAAEAGSAGQDSREYLFGLGASDADGRWSYRARWAFDDREERDAFDWLVTEMTAVVARHPDAHIYHYAPYEPTALKRLMGRYAIRGTEIDSLLRGRRFVDLYAVVRQALRAGVESYSIKQIEPFYAFVREVELNEAGDQRRIVELALERDDMTAVTADVQSAVEGYNRDDCRSALELRNWLERLRRDAIAGGANIPRPAAEPGEAPEKVTEREQRIEALRATLLARHPRAGETEPWTKEGRACWLLAYLLDWQYREDKAAWWDFFRLRDLPAEELENEPAAIAGLVFDGRLETVFHKTTGKPTGSVIDRYRFGPQEFEVRPGQELNLLKDGRKFGTVVAIDRAFRQIDVKKSKGLAEFHPDAVFVPSKPPPDTPAQSIFRIGEFVATQGIDASGPYRAARDLLLGRPPRVGASVFGAEPQAAGESTPDFAVRLAPFLDETVLPIQGPPGAGKTFTGARMIVALVAAGWRVGVTANSHKVVENLLNAVRGEADRAGQNVRLGQRVRDDDEGEDDSTDSIRRFRDNGLPRAALDRREIDVLGGTAWLWSREDFAEAVDVLFVDEAGQMSLANAIAVSQAARSVVLLGDPQQLEQPQKGSHPDGVGVSALQHALAGAKTMTRERGLFLPVTWRLPPAICEFTSTVFYEGKLTSKPGLERQAIRGSRRFDGAGLFLVEAKHDGCRNASDEEVDVVRTIVNELLSPGVEWIDEGGSARALRPADILVVAPYNAHVARLSDALEGRGVAVGTVDRFQGQEAPAVIYSMATSRPEDAPRGLEFLYNASRLNVATSRARAVSILVANPLLFEPECRTPRHLRLANALCAYRERALTT